jgi:hypothetical protein
MANPDYTKTLEQFMQLASHEIDVIAGRIKFEPEAQASVVKILHGLSVSTRKTTRNFGKAARGLPAARRKALYDQLDQSGVMDAVSLFIPLLKLGHATDPGFLLKEVAKTLHSAAEISDFWEAEVLATIFEGAALGFDIAAQLSEQADDEWTHDMIVLMDSKLSYIMDLPDGAAVPKTPADHTPVSLTDLEEMLEVCMKFYKFEGAFTPSFRKDKQLIQIEPPASAPVPHPIPVLVTGFIDLGGMRNHDVVTITTMVLEPSPTPHYVIWRVKTFAGHQSSGMKHFQEFTDLLEVPGDGVEILIAQSASAANFDPTQLLNIPYQFLVESTTAPQFTVT